MCSEVLNSIGPVQRTIVLNRLPREDQWAVLRINDDHDRLEENKMTVNKEHKAFKLTELIQIKKV